MAIKYICDKCGKTIGACEGVDIVISKRDLFGTLVLSKEICEECEEELKKWLLNEKEK